MNISDLELRALVRDAIARESARHTADESGNDRDVTHASHARFLRLAPSEDGQCVIEPAVRCNHCGYCQSYGH
jgi:hypothetical protein